MRIVGAVLIFIVSIINLIAGLGYTLGGGLIAGVGAGIGAVAKTEKAGAIDAKNRQEVEAGAKTAQVTGGLVLIFGVFLLAMCGMAIAAGVVLIMGKAKGFALTVGILQLVAEGIGCFLLASVGVTNILGVVAGVFVIIGTFFYPKPVDYANDPFAA